MMTRLIITCCLFSVLLACNNGNPAPADNDKKPKADVIHCYRYVNNKDTITLKTVDVNGFITGTLVYNLYEKDKNKGTIQGKMQDDLLVADYTFFSEGIQSVRQVAFKQTSNGFVEGYGNIEDTGGNVSFKNIDSLSFNNNAILSSISCE